MNLGIDPSYYCPMFLPTEEDKTQVAETRLNKALKERKSTDLLSILAFVERNPIFLRFNRAGYVIWLGDVCHSAYKNDLDTLIAIVSLDSYDDFKKTGGWTLFREALASHVDSHYFNQLVRDLIIGGVASGHPALALNCVLALGEVCKKKGCTYIAGKKIFAEIFPEKTRFPALDRIMMDFLVKEAINPDKQTLWDSYLARVALNIVCNCLTPTKELFELVFLGSFETTPPSLKYAAKRGLIRFASYSPCATMAEHCLSLMSPQDDAREDLLRLLKYSWNECPNIYFVRVFASMFDLTLENDPQLSAILKACSISSPINRQS